MQHTAPGALIHIVKPSPSSRLVLASLYLLPPRAALLALLSLAQAPTQSITPNVCTPPPIPEPKPAEERQRRAEWEKYRALLPLYAAQLPAKPDTKLLMPVRGVAARSVADTFGAPRSGERSHEGQDIFAPKGTPVYSATQGFVWRIGVNTLGGNYVFVAGPGGRHCYYAHLDRWAKGLKEGQKVTTGTLGEHRKRSRHAFPLALRSV